MTNTKQTSNYAGFTLVETLLVLFVTTFLIGLPSLLLERGQENVLVGQFFGSFERQVLHIQQLAVTGEEDTTIIFTKSNELAFLSAHTKNVLVIPKELEAVGPEKIIFKKGTGNNGRLSKYSFVWRNKKKQVDYQFQMGSGRYAKNIIAL
ncbi:competence type IV pilus minor pilin ComGD [Candidatus Enterococcus clewellii]|uniref:Competence protein ComGD n=1 Tax=Candidatus Enterococcus clewellii TaxID=1834193 RepID=A0A242K2T2_9ENTE|nr:competence type IV pilus minor pilin ComGD [Enterococcus sp. 9E7_DIV0242]OTP12804.1 hypothetical protein A5888_003383 [Enterococcus sp. 9E7_DIV0242]